MKLLPSRRVLCIPYTHAPCHFMHIAIVIATLLTWPRLYQQIISVTTGLRPRICNLTNNHNPRCAASFASFIPTSYIYTPRYKPIDIWPFTNKLKHKYAFNVAAFIPTGYFRRYKSIMDIRLLTINNNNSSCVVKLTQFIPTGYCGRYKPIWTRERL